MLEAGNADLQDAVINIGNPRLLGEGLTTQAQCQKASHQVIDRVVQ